MAVYNSLKPLTQVADLPEFQDANWFRKRNGKNTTFGNVFNAAVPALTTIAGTIIGGPAGTAIGQAAGQAIVGGVNQLNARSARLQGADDALAEIENDLPQDLATASLASNLAGMVNISAPAGGTASGMSNLQSVNPTADVGALGAGALDVSGMSAFGDAKNALTNSLAAGATQDTGWQARLSAPTGDVLPGLIGSAANALMKRPSVARPQTYRYARFAEGGKPEPGETPEQMQQRLAAQGGDFTKEWFLMRAMNNKAGLTPADMGLSDVVSKPVFVSDAEMRRLRPQKNPQAFTLGNYNHPSGTVRINTGAFDLSNPREQVQMTAAATHESTHEVQHEGLRANSDKPHPAWIRTESLINQALKQAGKPANGYIGHPQEVHARLMEMRQDAKFSPDQEITEKDYWKYLNYNQNNGRVYMELKSILDDKNILNLLNKTVENTNYTGPFNGFRAADGGKTYTHYPSSDKRTEDLILTDAKTGEYFGAMRYGERIYDQDATQTIEKAVKTLSMNPTAEGYAWLGKYVTNETLTHKDMRHFADGGKPQPKPKPVVDKYLGRQQTLTDEQYADIRQSAGRTINGALSIGDVATDIMQLGNFVPNPYAQAIGKVGNMAGAAIDGVQAAIALGQGNYGEAGINAASALLPSQIEKLGYLRNAKHISPALRGVNYYPVGGYYGSMSKVGLGANRTLMGGVLAETAYDAKPTYADGGKPEKPKGKPTVKAIQEELKKAGLYTGPVDGVFKSTMQAGIDKWNALPSTSRERKIVTSEDQPGNFSADFRGTDDYRQDGTDPTFNNLASLEFRNDKAQKKQAQPVTLPEVTVKAKRLPQFVDPEPNPYPTTGMPATLTANVNPAAPATAPATTPAAVVAQAAAEPKPAGYNWLSPGNVADAARTFIGFNQANRPLPENPINPDYLKLVSDAAQRQDEGLGPATRKLYKDMQDDSRSLAIESVRRLTGGGGSAGAAVAGLGAVNDATTNASLKLAAADEQANAINRSRYTQLLGGQIDLEQQRYGQVYNAALLNQQAGQNLAQQGLKGLNERYQIWNMYDRPGSAGQRFGQMQIDNQEAATKASKANYEYVSKLLSGKTS